MTEFTVRIIVLSLPGIICMFFLGRLAGKREQTSLETVFIVFVYSVLSYLIYSGFCRLCNLAAGTAFSCGLAEILSSGSYSPKASELLGGTIGAVFLSFLLAAMQRYNVLNLIGQKTRVTSRYGDDDVWHFFHNAPVNEKNDGWVFIRDHKCDLVYYGYINTWSDSGKQRELVISDVTVFHNKSGEELYSCEVVYISRNPDDLTIEVPRHGPKGVNHERQQEANRGAQQTCGREPQTPDTKT